MDSMHDALANGRTLRIFTLIDVHTRECLALEPATGFSGAWVAQILTDVGVDRARPERIPVDHGTESASKAVDAWACWQQVNLDQSRRGRLGDNARVEAFDSLVRRECLSQHWFTTLEEASLPSTETSPKLAPRVHRIRGEGSEGQWISHHLRLPPPSLKRTRP